MSIVSMDYAPLKTDSLCIRDPEVELIDRLSAASTHAGVRAARVDLANVYVALKHRQMAVLAGRAGSGKAALVECLASLLAGDSNLQRQVGPGHAWYAGMKAANSMLIHMHTRLITDKCLFLFEEALKPENAQRVFVVGLEHISQAELLCFFTEVAYQLQHNQIMRIGDTHLYKPVPYPPNLLMIGTLDTPNFNSWDEDLLSGATVIEWHGDTALPEVATVLEESPIQAHEFLHSGLHDGTKAYEKLLSIVASHRHPLQAVMLVLHTLQVHGVGFIAALLDDVVIFLANAWSFRGNGLFDPSFSRNLAIASDFAVAQLVLPHFFMAIEASKTLQADLYSILRHCLPRSKKYLEEHFWRDARQDGFAPLNPSNKAVDQTPSAKFTLQAMAKK